MVTRRLALKLEEQTLDDYEDPPIHETEEARVIAAISFYFNRNWTIGKSATKAGLDFGKVRR